MSPGFKLSSLCLLVLSSVWGCAPDLDSLVAGNDSGGSKNTGGSGSTGGNGGEGDEGAGPAAGPGSCENGVRNSDETDVDCGGKSECGPCGTSLKCNADDDCSSAFCKGGRCAEPTCGDEYKNQDETATDCGGICSTIGEACDDNVACEVNEDCKSEFCQDSICIGHCESGVREADETDKDCGGADCAPCATGGRCEESGDCEGQVCFNNECQAPTCSDRVQNQDESDKDCGGVCSDEEKACAIGKRCDTGADCDSYVCTKGKCVADLDVAADDFIDDFEDNDMFLSPLGERVGNWYTYGDGSGTAAAAPTAIERGLSSKRAMRTTGHDFTGWGSGVGVDLNNMGSGESDKAVYDASAYSGVTFWARAESKMTITLVLPDGDTDKAGKKCNMHEDPEVITCDHHYYHSFLVDTTWQRYTFYFADDFPMPEAGNDPVPDALDPSTLVSVQYRVGANTTYEFYIDDLAFVR
jgi:hypothetical protein